VCQRLIFTFVNLDHTFGEALALLAGWRINHHRRGADDFRFDIGEQAGGLRHGQWVFFGMLLILTTWALGVSSL
jgi:hypothetical protein